MDVSSECVPCTERAGTTEAWDLSTVTDTFAMSSEQKRMTISLLRLAREPAVSTGGVSRIRRVAIAPPRLTAIALT